MARTVHAVVRLDNPTGMIDGARVHSGRYVVQTTSDGVTTSTPTDIDNGFPVKIGALEEGEREIRVCTAAAANEKDWGIVSTPEVDDTALRNYYDLQDFYNKAGDPIRVHVLPDHNIFSVTQEALDGTPTVGQKINFGGANGKWKVGNTGVATCIAIDTVGTAVAISGRNLITPITFYAFEVDPA